MRNRSCSAIVIVAVLSIRCGGGLDQDYTSRFAATWNGAIANDFGDGIPQGIPTSERLDTAGVNRLSVPGMCPGATAKIDSPTSFSIDPITCPPISVPCGPVTVRFDGGTGNLTQNMLTVKLEGTNTTCGQTVKFTSTFVGTRVGGTGVRTGGGTQSSITLNSDTGDFIGIGGTYHYTTADAAITVLSSGGYLSVIILGKDRWQGDFHLPSRFSQIVPGTYSGLSRYPFHDPAVGGLTWSGQGRGCNEDTGSMTVDSVTYGNGSLATIDFRFEQTCQNAQGALHGQIHWDVNDPTVQPAPTPLLAAPE